MTSPEDSASERYTAADKTELKTIAEHILSRHPEARIFAFTGPMGVGKTTLIHAFLRVLGVSDRGASPTFSLVNEYRTHDGEPVYHFDFYRIESVEEVYDIGYEVYFYGGHRCFMEWAEKVEELLPEDTVLITMEKEGEKRVIRVSRATG